MTSNYLFISYIVIYVHIYVYKILLYNKILYEKRNNTLDVQKREGERKENEFAS